VASVTVEEVDAVPFCNKDASDMLSVIVGTLVCVFICAEFVILLSINDNEEGTGVKTSRIVVEVHGVLKLVSLEEAATLEVIDEEFPGSEKDDKTKRVPQAFVSFDNLQHTGLAEFSPHILSFRFALEDVFHLKAMINENTKKEM